MALLRSKPCKLDLTDIFEHWKSENLKRVQRDITDYIGQDQSERLGATHMMPPLKIESKPPMKFIIPPSPISDCYTYSWEFGYLEDVKSDEERDRRAIIWNALSTWSFHLHQPRFQLQTSLPESPDHRISYQQYPA
ncbi:MAG: hypothetical protein Q9194_003786 [Teloschistes cf. exilis]